MKKLLIIATLLASAACVHENQYVTLAPRFDEVKSNIGNGAKIDLMVIDDRYDDQIIGVKEFGPDEKINIINENNIAILLTKKINQALEAKGFTKGSDKIVEVHIEKLQYKAKREFFVGASSGEASIKFVIKTAKNKPVFTKTFNLITSNKHFIAPLASTDSVEINDLLQEVVQEALNSEDLMKMLAR